MPQSSLPAAAEGLPISREQVEAQIDLLIDLLNTIDADPDMEPDLAGYDRGMDDREGDDSDFEPDTHDEPSLGFSTGGHYPENQMQDGPGFYMNTDAGRGLEDEHTGEESDVDGEANLGWRNEGPQTGYWAGNSLVALDAEGTSPEFA